MVSQILIRPDTKRDAAAAILAADAHTWPIVTLKKAFGAFPVGTAFFGVPSSDGGHYLCNTVVCQCVDYRRGNVCKHIRAACLVDERERTPVKKDYAALYPSCWTKGCTDDLEPGEQACWRHVNVSAF